MTENVTAQLYSSGNNVISGNKVGIGTNSPSTSLFVKAEPYQICINPPCFNPSLYRKTSPFHVQYYYNPEPPIGPLFNPPHRTAIFVKWDGLIGIHTDNPLEAFHINAVIRGGEASGALKLQTDHGYLQIGALNPSFMHFYTDMDKFYFHKRLIIDQGIISSYNEDLRLQTEEITRITVKKSNGDVIINGGDLILEDANGNNQFKVGADGLVRAREIKVDLTTIPDYVFAEDYDLMPLKEVREFINENKHLPNVKSEAEFQEEGSISLTEMNIKLLEKVEELTLYLLELETRINELEVTGGTR